MPIHNLPLQLTSFIGREREQADLLSLLSTSRLVTLLGAGGSGKTRLAIQVAGYVQQRYPDDVWLVELEALRDAKLLSQLVTQTLKISVRSDQNALDTILEFLASKEMLLVLDNCEHMIAECSQLAGKILAQASKISILATSREALGIAGEVSYPVEGLERPAPAVDVVSFSQDWMKYDAVSLFVSRVQSIVPGFSLTPDNITSVLNICSRLDGLPLGLELASARCNVLTPQQIAERLDDRFGLLTYSPTSGSDPRHGTMQAAIDWSYDLLAMPEQILLRRLAVFAGGYSLAVVEKVCSGDGIEQQQIFELLASLVNKSLVGAQTLQRQEARYFLLETIREYARRKLLEAVEGEKLRNRHLHSYLELVEDAATRLSGPYQHLWLKWLDDEYDNIRLALSWSLESRQVEAGLRIGIAVYQFWTIRDYVEEGLSWMESFLNIDDQPASPIVRANALAYAAFLAGFRGKTQEQVFYGGQAALLAEASGGAGKPALRWALAAQAYGARASGDFQTDYELGERVIAINRELGDTYQLALTLSLYSFSAMSLGKLDAAKNMLQESLPMLRKMGNPYRIAMALNFSGDLARCEQNYSAAQSAYEESIGLLRELDAARDLASALQNLGYTSLYQGNPGRARELFDESLAIQISLHNTPGIAECLVGYARLAVEEEDPAAAARLLAAAVELSGARVATAWAAARMEYEGTLKSIHARLSEHDFKFEQQKGRAYTSQIAVEYAQVVSKKIAQSGRIQEGLDELTGREREVVTLIASGKSNQEIADEFVLSKRTVEKHIAHVISKLGVSNRTQIVRWAMESGLIKVSDNR